MLQVFVSESFEHQKEILGSHTLEAEIIHQSMNASSESLAEDVFAIRNDDVETSLAKFFMGKVTGNGYSSTTTNHQMATTIIKTLQGIREAHQFLFLYQSATI